VHSPKTRKYLKWFKEAFEKNIQIQGRLGYWDGFEAEFKLNDKRLQ
jgi:hypothetical protein